MIANAKEIDAIYVFGDIRGFSKWSADNQTEIEDLLNMYYEICTENFGSRREEMYLQRIVKYLGDGFFAVNEFKEKDTKDFLLKCTETINNCGNIIFDFKKRISRLKIHDKEDLAIGLGVSFGKSLRFNLPGHPTDYAGKRINYASRLCGKAEGSEILLEKEFLQYINSLSLERIYRSLLKNVELKSIGNYKSLSLILDI